MGLSYYLNDPVCGDDGHTYESMCQFTNKVCKTKGALRMKHKGQCKGTIVVYVVGTYQFILGNFNSKEYSNSIQLIHSRYLDMIRFSSQFLLISTA